MADLPIIIDTTFGLLPCMRVHTGNILVPTIDFQEVENLGYRSRCVRQPWCWQERSRAHGRRVLENGDRETEGILPARCA